MEQHDVIAVEAQRLDRADDGFGVFIEVGDDDCDAAPMQKRLKVLERMAEISSRARLRVFEPREEPRKLALSAWTA